MNEYTLVLFDQLLENTEKEAVKVPVLAGLIPALKKLRGKYSVLSKRISRKSPENSENTPDLVQMEEQVEAASLAADQAIERFKAASKAFEAAKILQNSENTEVNTSPDGL